MKSVCNRQRQIPQGIKGKYECLHFVYKKLEKDPGQTE